MENAQPINNAVDSQRTSSRSTLNWIGKAHTWSSSLLLQLYLSFCPPLEIAAAVIQVVVVFAISPLCNRSSSLFNDVTDCFFARRQSLRSALTAHGYQVLTDWLLLVMDDKCRSSEKRDRGRGKACCDQQMFVWDATRRITFWFPVKFIGHTLSAIDQDSVGRTHS